MINLLKSGRALFATALIVFGIIQFITGSFVVGRAPTWTWAQSAVSVWAYLTGTVLMIAGVAILTNRKAQMAVIVIGIMILLGPVIRLIPVIAVDRNFGGDWTNFFKSLALAGCSFIVASSIRASPGNSQPGSITMNERLETTGRIFIALFFICGGIQHFKFADFVKTLVPAWIPGQLFWTYFAGIALLLAGAGLMIRKTVSLAALLSGLMIFT